MEIFSLKLLVDSLVLIFLLLRMFRLILILFRLSWVICIFKLNRFVFSRVIGVRFLMIFWKLVFVSFCFSVFIRKFRLFWFSCVVMLLNF